MEGLREVAEAEMLRSDFLPITKAFSKTIVSWHFEILRKANPLAALFGGAQGGGGNAQANPLAALFGGGGTPKVFAIPECDFLFNEKLKI